MPYLAYFFRLHRASLIAVLLSASVLFAVIAVAVNGWRLAHNNQTHGKSSALPTPLPLKQSDVLVQSLPTAAIDIAELVHREADSANISIEEISYESRVEHDLPIVLRSASFTLTENYKAIRQYLDSVVHAQSNLTLDALDCTRDDISSPEVNCVITVSAYQRYNPSQIASTHVN